VTSNPALLPVREASEADAIGIAELRSAAADKLTAQFGSGHWSHPATEKGVLLGMKHARLLVMHDGARLVGTLRLATRKPWAIDPAYFTMVDRALYLTDMAVAPPSQRLGGGRGLLEYAVEAARQWPADCIRLDAYDAPAGAGGFYSRCGFREVGRVVYRKTPLIYFEKLLPL